MLKRFFTLQEKCTSAWQQFRFRSLGVDLDTSCWIGGQASASLGLLNGSIGRIQLAKAVRLEQGVILQAWGGNITIAENVFIGPYTIIYGHGGITIGKDSLIAMHCRILSSNHAMPAQSQLIRWQPDVLLPTTIGSDVWLGAGVTVLGGVKIGDGCVVGAGAVVTKDLPPYSIAVGVPAQVIGTRSQGVKVCL